MTAATPVDQVVEYLEAHGYKQLPAPLVISGLTFELPAALVGVEKSTDLILVADTAFDQDDKILRMVQGVARALDVARSRRPLTAVIAGPPPNAATVEAMSGVCRVLPIGRIDSGKAEHALKNWLAVLTPLKLPEPGASIADPITELETDLDGFADEIAALTDTASQGSKAVKRRLNEILKTQLEDAWEAEE